MQIFLINNDGGGFARTIDVAEGTSITQLFEKEVPGRRAEDYLIRVDRQPVAPDHLLTPGVRVSITPTKIAGAGKGGAGLSVGQSGARQVAAGQRKL